MHANLEGLNVRGDQLAKMIKEILKLIVSCDDDDDDDDNNNNNNNNNNKNKIIDGV